MARIRVVTDSTANIPEDLRLAAGIEIVPLSVNFGNESLRDGIDITQADFLKRLKASGKNLPTTAQPPPGLFEEIYLGLADEGAEEIVSVHISDSLSGTCGSARIAAEDVAGRVKVEVVDSRSICIGLGFIALEAARVANSGGDLAAITAAIRKMITNIHIIFFPDTLEYLQKGGRIGRAAMIVGSIISLKPLLRVDEGVVVPHERTRTRSKAIDGLVRFTKDFPHIRQLAAMQVGDADIEILLDRLSPIYPREKIILTETSPVIGVHLGEGALGVIIDSSEGTLPSPSA